MKRKFMDEGYVIFINKNEKYLKLLDILIESILMFSTRPVEIFSINFDYNHSSERVFNSRISTSNESYETICYSKILSSLSSRFNFGIQLDADFIITKEMDKLFDLRNNKDYPLYSLHPHDPNNQDYIMSYLRVADKTQPYVHGTYLFSDSSKPFLERCYKMSQNLLNERVVPPNIDETLMNVMLWKEGVTDSFIDPYDIWFEYFLSERSKKEESRVDYGICGKKVNFYSSHGCKDINVAQKIFDILKKEQLSYEN
jgi:hypothetical protein